MSDLAGLLQQRPLHIHRSCNSSTRYIYGNGGPAFAGHALGPPAPTTTAVPIVVAIVVNCRIDLYEIKARLRRAYGCGRRRSAVLDQMASWVECQPLLWWSIQPVVDLEDVGKAGGATVDAVATPPRIHEQRDHLCEDPSLKESLDLPVSRLWAWKVNQSTVAAPSQSPICTGTLGHLYGRLRDSGIGKLILGRLDRRRPEHH